jgi:(2Fe-2S) ferredoxin
MAERELKDDAERLKKLAPVTAAPVSRHVFVCNGKSCSAAGSAGVKATFEAELQARNLRQGKESKGRNPTGPVVLTDCSSVGFCSIGPAVLVYPDGVWYARVRAEDVPQIVYDHLVEGKTVERLALFNVPVTTSPCDD